jgi:hypothetical protein
MKEGNQGSFSLLLADSFNLVVTLAEIAEEAPHS